MSDEKLSIKKKPGSAPQFIHSTLFSEAASQSDRATDLHAEGTASLLLFATDALF